MLMISDQDCTGQEFTAYVTDCIEMQDILHKNWINMYGKSVADTETLLDVQKELKSLPNEPFNICIESGDLNTDTLAEEVTLCWQQYRSKNRYALSVTYAGDAENGKDAMMPFCCLMEEECMTKLENSLTQKDSFPDYIRLERVNGLDIYTFRIEIPGQYNFEKEYLVVLNGIWEGQEICWQYVTFPTTNPYITPPADNYSTIPADINYDGFADLFIREGFSSGSGGSWTNYRAITWQEDSQQFIWYDSFPAQVSSTEYDRKRMIDRYQLGAFEEHVVEYKVVNGEYKATRELAWIDNTLSYYEMGVLVREYDTTDMKFEEICTLYPDLDYWWRG